MMADLPVYTNQVGIAQPHCAAHAQNGQVLADVGDEAGPELNGLSFY